MVMSKMAVILSNTFEIRISKTSGFRMIPVFECSVSGSPMYLVLELIKTNYLVTRRNDKWDHGGSISSGQLQTFDQLFHFPDLDIFIGGGLLTHPAKKTSLDCNRFIIKNMCKNIFLLFTLKYTQSPNMHKLCCLSNKQLSQCRKWQFLMVIMYNMVLISVPKLAIEYCFFMYHFATLNIGY